MAMHGDLYAAGPVGGAVRRFDLLPMAAWQPTRMLEFDRVHIRYLGNGYLWFRFYSGSLLEKSPKSNQKGSCPTTRHLA